MSPLFMVWRSTFRNPLRTSLTALGVAIAIVAFLVLRTLIVAWTSASESSASDRLIVRNKVSVASTLPLSYLDKTRRLVGKSGVVSFQSWFRGIYPKDEKGFFASFAADDNVLDIYPEAIVEPAELDAWRHDRQGALVGKKLADKYGWKPGDRVTLRGTIYPGDWDFVIRAIYDSDTRAFDPSTLFVHWAYLNDRLSERGRDKIGMLLVRVTDVGVATSLGEAIDRNFASSLAETRTESEKAYQLEILSMVSAIVSAIRVVSGVVMLILLLILANTLAMATRERTVEYAVLRAIGFRSRYIVAMVLGEGLTVAALGVFVGVLLSMQVIAVFGRVFEKSMGGALMRFQLHASSVLMATAATLTLGMLAAVVPAWRSGAVPIVDALRRVD